ncbi:MAG: Crp/Fnr family transcriptional regulator [Gaiellaceae bacterium]
MELIESTLRQKSATILALADIRHTDRVRRKLMQLAGDHGRDAPDGVHVQFPLTHELLAEMVGSARETVTRALDVLEREDFVRRDGRSYRLLVAPETLVP